MDEDPFLDILFPLFDGQLYIRIFFLRVYHALQEIGFYMPFQRRPFGRQQFLNSLLLLPYLNLLKNKLRYILCPAGRWQGTMFGKICLW